jgi:hypothetical protein
VPLKFEGELERSAKMDGEPAVTGGVKANGVDRRGTAVVEVAGSRGWVAGAVRGGGGAADEDVAAGADVLAPLGLAAAPGGNCPGKLGSLLDGVMP